MSRFQVSYFALFSCVCQFIGRSFWSFCLLLLTLFRKMRHFPEFECTLKAKLKISIYVVQHRMAKAVFPQNDSSGWRSAGRILCSFDNLSYHNQTNILCRQNLLTTRFIRRNFLPKFGVVVFIEGVGLLYITRTPSRKEQKFIDGFALILRDALYDSLVIDAKKTSSLKEMMSCSYGLLKMKRLHQSGLMCWVSAK